MPGETWKYPCGCVDRIVKVAKGYECTPVSWCREHTPSAYAVRRFMKTYMRKEHPKDTSGAIQIGDDHG